MDKIINLCIPHVGEQIFASLDTENLIYCLDVSQTWRVLAERIFIKRKDSFFKACKIGNLKILKLLLEHYNDEEDRLNTTDNNGWTPLMWASLKRRNHIVHFLLNHSDLKINLDAEDNNKDTAFSLACLRGYEDIIKLFLEKEKEEQDQTQRLVTCLEKMRQNGKWEAFRNLRKFLRTRAFEKNSEEIISLIEKY